MKTHEYRTLAKVWMFQHRAEYHNNDDLIEALEEHLYNIGLSIYSYPGMFDDHERIDHVVAEASEGQLGSI